MRESDGRTHAHTCARVVGMRRTADPCTQQRSKEKGAWVCRVLALLVWCGDSKRAHKKTHVIPYRVSRTHGTWIVLSLARYTILW